MASEDFSSRIPKGAFEATITALFAIACLSVCARFYIRLRVQKEFSPDDVFLILGLCCMVVSFTVVSYALDDIFFVESLLFSHKKGLFSFNNIDRSLRFKKLAAVSLIFSWLALMSVKFSFLMLFWRLIDRIPGLRRYWWVVVAFNIIVTAYGIAVYLVACPHFNFFAAVHCLSPSFQRRELYFAISQNIPDVIGDLMIVYIPIRLLWKIKVRLTKKLALACSLCLTLIVICFTLIRAIAINYDGQVDNGWEIFWQTVAAEIALILTAMTAFRALYISRARRQAENMISPPPAASYTSGCHSLWMRLKMRIPWLRRWVSRSPSSSSPAATSGSCGKRMPKHDRKLPSIPRATITHLRTFIDGQGRSRNSSSSSGGDPLGTTSKSRDGRDAEPEEDEWPLQSISGQRRLIAREASRDSWQMTMHGRSVNV